MKRPLYEYKFNEGQDVIYNGMPLKVSGYYAGRVVLKGDDGSIYYVEEKNVRSIDEILEKAWSEKHQMIEQEEIDQMLSAVWDNIGEPKPIGLTKEMLGIEEEQTEKIDLAPAVEAIDTLMKELLQIEEEKRMNMTFIELIKSFSPSFWIAVAVEALGLIGIIIALKHWKGE